MSFRIFVSSTFLDLREEREAVARVLQGLKNIYVGMEFFGPRDEPPLETSLREVAGSNLYVGIFSERYGTLDPVTSKSITELEYRKARELKLPCAIFFRDPTFVSTDTIYHETDPIRLGKLRELKKELEENHTPAWFNTSADLARQVEVYLPRLMAGLYVHTKGIPPPRPPEFFVGREEELSELKNRLTMHGLAVVAGVHGMGGIGKTALAQVFAFRNAAEFPDGIFWLPLAGHNPNILLQDIARALGADVKNYADLETRAGAVRALLTGKRALIIYDDITEADASFLHALRMPCAIIITTRLTHLPVIDPREMFELETLTESEALALCREILGSGRVDTDFEGARELCKTTGYLPLALTIALRVLYNDEHTTPRKYAERLRGQIHALEELALMSGIKDLNVRASFDLSYATLAEADRLRYRQLAVFTSGEFGIELAAQIVGDEGTIGKQQSVVVTNTRDTLQRFADCALATRLDGGRYRIHTLLRSYADELLHKAGEDMGVWKRAADAYFAFARAKSNNWNELEVERDNIFGILDWCLKASENTLLAEIVECQERFWWSQGYWEQQINWLEHAIEVRHNLGDRKNESINLHNLASTRADRGEISRARDLFQESLELSQELSDRQGMAATLRELGRIAFDLGDYITAQKFLQQSLELERDLCNKRGVADTLHELGRIPSVQGDHINAQDLFHQCQMPLEVVHP